MSNPIQHIKTSFSAGELTPAMAGRVDIGKYQIGCEKMENMYSEIYGSASNRPGTKFILASKGNDYAFLKEFKYSTEDVYLLVFTPNTLRFIYDGGFIDDGGSVYEIATPWSTWEEIRQLTFAQSADFMWVCSPFTESVQELKRIDATNWTLNDLTDSPSSEITPINATATTEIEGILGKLNKAYSQTTYVNYSTVTVEINEDTIGDGASIPNEGTISISGGPALPYTSIVIDGFTSTFDVIFTLTTTWQTEDTYYEGTSVDIADATGVNSSNLAAKYGPTTSYSTIEVKEVSSQPNGVDELVLGGYTVPYISWKEISGVYTFTLKAPFSPGTSLSTGLPVIIGRSFREYVVTGLSGGQESKQSNIASVYAPYDVLESYPIVIEWDDPSDLCEAFNLYRKEQGEFYWIGTISANGTGTQSFEDTGLDWDESTSPPGDSILPVDKALRCVALFNQRLMFANGIEKPNTLWASQTGLFNDFSKSFIAKSTDGFERTLDSGTVNEIRHLIQIGNTLIALTSGGTWSIGSADSVSLNLDTVTASYQGDISASKYVRPLVVQNDVMVIQDKGQTVSPLTYNLDQDGYISNDVSIWAKHLFEGHEIANWCYQKSPSSIIWMVRDDGIMIGLTYLKEQEVWAFHQHNTGKRVSGDSYVYDKIISVESIPNTNDNVDDVYMCIERVINGSTSVFIEKMMKRDASDGLGVGT